jgi:hypothetical protein
MTDFTVENAGCAARRVMVSRDRKLSKSWPFYHADITGVFAQLAEAFNAQILRDKGQDYFLILPSEIEDLQAIVTGHGCSLALAPIQPDSWRL